MENQKNIILAVVLSVAIMVGWQYIFPNKPKAPLAEQNQTTQPNNVASGGITTPMPSNAGQIANIHQPIGEISIATALNSGNRLIIESPVLSGSVNLKGLFLDDLILTKYNEHLGDSSQKVRLFEPKGTKNAYFAHFGFTGSDAPNPETIWVANKPKLSAGDSVILSTKSKDGVEFQLILSLDKNYMFAITQKIINASKNAVNYAPYSLIGKNNFVISADSSVVLHEGLAGVVNDELHEVNFTDILDKKRINYETDKGGWLGFTNKYWQAILAPEQNQKLHASLNGSGDKNSSHFQVDYIYDAQNIAPQSEFSVKTQLFAGAKEIQLIRDYNETNNINKFDLSVDFGMLYIMTKPMYFVLDWLFNYFGNFGLALMGLTVIVKLIMLPLAWKSQVSMSKMKILQPKMEELKKKYGDSTADKTAFQTELMALYKREKLNPLAGCLPMFVQIPVFFALYKTLYITIEMRHAPFYGWIQDLSVPDPYGLLTLFGLIAWQVPTWLSFINLGIWPLLLGLTMWGQQRLNPAPTDPIQAKVFAWMPLMFTFMLAPFAAGLVIYWAWNNALSILQQYIIMKTLDKPKA